MARNGDPNKYAGTCTQCHQAVGERGGEIRYNAVIRKWTVRHRPLRVVAPTGPWDKFDAYETGGCPVATEGK